MTKILPPPELSPRVVRRDPSGKHHAAPEDSIRGAVHSAVIRWRDLVLAVWELPSGEEYTGELPAGLSSQQFWAKVTRAARALGGAVGVATRGSRWWVWSVRRGRASRKPIKHAELLDSLLAGIDWMTDDITQADEVSIRNAAARHGIRVRFDHEAGGIVMVRNMGAVKRRTK